MIAKILAGASAGVVMISACMVDSMNSTPFWVCAVGVIVMGVTVMANKKVFE